MTGFSSVGFSASSSGAATSLMSRPPCALAAPAMSVKIFDGETEFAPSRHHDVVQIKCVRARVTAT